MKIMCSLGKINVGGSVVHHIIVGVSDKGKSDVASSILPH